MRAIGHRHMSRGWPGAQFQRIGGRGFVRREIKRINYVLDDGASDCFFAIGITRQQGIVANVIDDARNAERYLVDQVEGFRIEDVHAFSAGDLHAKAYVLDDFNRRQRFDRRAQRDALFELAQVGLVQGLA